MPRSVEYLANLPVGSTFLLPCRLTAKSGTGASVDILTKAPSEDDWEVSGAFTIAVPDGTIAGDFTIDPREQPVQVIAFALKVGDVVQSDQDGSLLVVAAINLGPDRNLWSPTASGSRTFSGVGWTVVNHITMTP